MEREIIVCRDIDELNRKAADQFLTLANKAIQESGQFAVALSGGSTPKALYALLASDAAAQVTFLVSGESKRAIVKQLLGAGGDAANFPAAKVSPTDGKLTWLITEDAAADLRGR